MRPRAAQRLRFSDGTCLELGRRTAVMGVLNVTPDSFSDGGRFDDPGRALDQARRLAGEGADVIDVGGESTRPGAAPVSEAEECRRILPVVAGIKRELSVRLSIDTSKPGVARRALDAGADMINDVSALGDPGMLPLVLERAAPIVLMHMRGTPATMQTDTIYADLVGEVVAWLGDRVRDARREGVADDKILVDPGIGFGKSAAGNLALLARIHRLGSIGPPVLIGVSRKSFIGALGDLPVDRRLPGSLAVAAWAASGGVHVVRVHDVEPTVRALSVIDAIRAAGAETIAGG